jgi:6-phosphogluconate dehydrogenase
VLSTDSARGRSTFGEKMLSAMRFGFGGHIEGNKPIDLEPTPAESRGPSAAKNAAE